MTAPVPDLALADGRRMPQLGLGVFQIPDAQAPDLLAAAFAAGYRAIDTAKAYGNEAGVGRGLRDGGLARDEVFVTTKLWNDDHGHAAARRAFDASLDRLGLDAVDLYLIHWPVPRQGRAVETWKALVQLRDEGRVRSIGVSNFRPADLRAIVQATGVTPALNQIELHPRFQQTGLRALHDELGIATQAWSPLGRGGLLVDPSLGRIAARHARTPAQIVLRWHMQIGAGAIPKSANPARLAQNIALFDFALDDADLAQIAALDRPDGRTGPDPDAFPG